MSVTEAGKVSADFDYHPDGQIASVTYADGRRENCLWDGLALIHRDGTELLINEPAVTGGNPVFGSESGVMFNDMLGTTLGIKGDDFTRTNLTAFGENLDAGDKAFFTGKPLVGELGYAFLFRNYRPEQGKWQTADPLGYPDGWNNFAYCNNNVNTAIDIYGLSWTTEDMYQYYLNGNGYSKTLADMGLKNAVWATLNMSIDNTWENGGEWWRGLYLPYSCGTGNNPTGFMDRMQEQIILKGENNINKSMDTGTVAFSYNFSNGYNFSPIVWAMGGGVIRVTMSNYTISWENGNDGYIYYSITGTYNLHFSDIFEKPAEIPYLEWGDPYAYGDSWKNQSINLSGKIRE